LRNLLPGSLGSPEDSHVGLIMAVGGDELKLRISGLV
jgi:hypothetical protein